MRRKIHLACAVSTKVRVKMKFFLQYFSVIETNLSLKQIIQFTRTKLYSNYSGLLANQNQTSSYRGGYTRVSARVTRRLHVNIQIVL